METYSGQSFGIDDPRHYTLKDAGMLLVEATDEVQAVLTQMLMEKAMKEAVSYRPSIIGPDLERELWDNLDLFEDYINITKERDKANEPWIRLRYARSTWWSLFKEEMDSPWLEYDQFVSKLDKRMREVEPSQDQWNKAMSLKSLIYQRCLSKQQARRDITYPIYLKAKEATDKCRAFWATKEGRILNALNEERTALWNAIKELNVTWEDYNTLLNTEINPYFTNGDTEEVDTMEAMANTVYEQLDLMEDASHTEDSSYLEAESTGPAFWSYRNQARATHMAKEKAQAQEMEADYQASLMSFSEDFFCTNTTLTGGECSLSC